MQMRFRYVLIFIALLAPFFLRDYTVDNELKYISIAEEALDNGTWFTFYNHGEAYADKPPLYLWIVMLSKLLFGSYQMWFIGLASVLPLIGILIVMGRWMKEVEGFPSAAAEIMLATTGMFLGSALVIRMDMLMAFFIVLSIYTFWLMYTGRSRPRHRWLLPVWVFLALFTKGPVGLLVPIVSMAVFLAVKGELKTFGRYFGWRQWAVLVGLCVVWFGLVYMEGGKAYIDNLLIKQTVGRGINAFHHKEPWWYYLAHLPHSFAPWTLLAFSVIIVAAVRRLIRTDLERIFVCVIVSTIVMLSIFSSKLDIYLLPVYPFVIYLAAIYIGRYSDRWWAKLSAALPAVIFILLLPAAIVACATDRIPVEYESLTMAFVALGVLAATSVVALVQIFRGRISRGVIWCGGGLLAMIAVASTSIGQFNPYLGVSELSAEGQRLAEENGLDRYAFYRFRSGENMDVYLGVSPERIADVAQLDSLCGTGESAILFARTKDIVRDTVLASRVEMFCNDRVAVGEYEVMVLSGGQPASQQPDVNKNQTDYE